MSSGQSSAPRAVKVLMAKGYAFPCACCMKMLKALQAGHDSCAAFVPPGKDCGGPASGMSFPLYEGPLTPALLATRCYRCGEPAAEAVTSTQQPEKFIGACAEHMRALELMAPDVPEARLRP